ncbi:hypothetical protein KSF_066440 [Reticulibacter mediterranei]|uniref:Uncharacterized protein n=1 Tax=Reticulibacter mediterranei TaxID=2778369 RepID=A0A8J3IL97_9CHLR|nr:hypothetical protein KSF_066440 [Reticulibacter mediterranei]
MLVHLLQLSALLQWDCTLATYHLRMAARVQVLGVGRCAFVYRAYHFEEVGDRWDCTYYNPYIHYTSGH